MNDDVPLGLLIGLFIVLLVLSAFFSATETALMSLNRYRLRRLARSGHRSARIADALLRRPARLIGLILLGNHAVNLAAAALVTFIALRLGGEGAVWAAMLALTFVVLIFAEVAPKKFAALHPSKIGLPAALVCYPLQKLAAPLVRTIDLIANGLLRAFGVRPDTVASDPLATEELRAAVAENGAMVAHRRQHVLLSILDLDAITVDDVMVPRQEIVGIDLDRDWPDNVATICESRFHRLPVYRGDIDNMIGVVRVRKLLSDIANSTLNEERLLKHTLEPHFVPEGTPLNKQMLNFREHTRRSAFVVDEYGDVQGLITTEDIVREIVGEFDAEASPSDLRITEEGSHSYIVDASANVRQLNRAMNWSLPTDGAKTLNGLIIERLETIPESGTGVTVANYPIEILDTTEHGIKRVRVSPPAIGGERGLRIAESR